MPMTVPTLPILWHNFSAGPFPITKDTESPTFESHSSGEAAKAHRRNCRSIGTRISTPQSVDPTSRYPRRRSLTHSC